MNNITSYYGDLGIFLYYTPIVSAFMAAFALPVSYTHLTLPTKA